MTDPIGARFDVEDALDLFKCALRRIKWSTTKSPDDLRPDLESALAQVAAAVAHLSYVRAELVTRGGR